MAQCLVGAWFDPRELGVMFQATLATVHYLPVVNILLRVDSRYVFSTSGDQRPLYPSKLLQLESATLLLKSGLKHTCFDRKLMVSELTSMSA